MTRKHRSKLPRQTRIRRKTSRAFTLVEMLVATTLTLLVIFAMAQAFAVVSETIRAGRATMEMSGGIRQTSWRLQQDLEGVTVPVRPWTQSSWGLGYFEYFDGASCDLDADGDGLFDYDPNNTTTNKNLSLGDVDDVLMFTARRVESAFLGRVNATAIESDYAEVAWWIEAEDINQNLAQDPGEYFKLHRRAMLIRPDLNGTNGYVARLPAAANTSYNTSSQGDLKNMYDDIVAFLNSNDLSVRFQRQENASNVVLFIVANSLSDLTLRQNRLCHDPVVYQRPNNQYAYLGLSSYDALFPYPMNIHQTTHPVFAPNNPIRAAFALRRIAQFDLFQGEDVMLSHLLAFDVRAYDPFALLSVHQGIDSEWGAAGVNDDGNGPTDGSDYNEAGWPGTDDEIVGPGDPGYGDGGNIAITASKNILPIAQGAYVDLNFFAKYGITNLAASRLSGAVSTGSQLAASHPARSGTYDTWAFDYEVDGVDQDGDSVIDEGTNGFDDDATSNGVDDEAERETAPPYSHALRGITVHVRVIEPDTRQVRQVSVTTNFIPE